MPCRRLRGDGLLRPRVNLAGGNDVTHAPALASVACARLIAAAMVILFMNVLLDVTY